MPIFVCDQCNVIENTATSLFWNTVATNKPALCSQCDPKLGKWHNIFPREKWDGKIVVYNRPAKEEDSSVPEPQPSPHQ